MRSFRAPGGLMFFGALLLPLVAYADSQLASGTQGPLTATAHLRFRIIIPTVLSLNVAESTRTAGAQTVTVASNSRNAARKGIAQEASCTPGVPQEAMGNKEVDPVKRFCTVSMP